MSFQPAAGAIPQSFGQTGFTSAARTPFVLPKDGQWSLDAKGQLADPVTLYIHGDLSQLEQTLAADGWTKADAGSLKTDAKYVGAAVADEALKGAERVDERVDRIQQRVDSRLKITEKKPVLPTTSNSVATQEVDKLVNEMPVSPQTYQGHPLLAGYERHNNPVAGRDHLRIFDTGQVDSAGKPVYAIAASQDSGIVLAPNHPETGFVFHAVKPDVSGERDAVLQSLQQGGARLLAQLSLGWAGASVYGEKVEDGKAYEVALP